MDCRKLVKQALSRWREINKARADKEVGDPRKMLSRFAKEARSDLESLCQVGANPFVLIWIVDTELWWWDGYSVEAAELEECARRKFSTPTYWRSCLRGLVDARTPLLLLIKYAWVQFAAVSENDETPFKRISRNVVAASRATADLVKTVEEMGLNEPGWELVQEGSRSMPELRKTTKAAQQLGGRSRATGWGRCAAVLHAYLTLITRKPHWVSIVRLLKAAGVADFGFEVARESASRTGQSSPAAHDPMATYADMVKKRVRTLRKDPVGRCELDDLARGYNIRFGGDGMR